MNRNQKIVIGVAATIEPAGGKDTASKQDQEASGVGIEKLNSAAWKLVVAVGVLLPILGALLD